MSPLSRSQSRLLHQESMSLQNRLVPFQYSPKSLRQRKLLVPTAPKGNNHGAHGIRVGIKLRQVRFYYSDLPATTLPLANERSYKTTLQDLRAHIVRSAVGDNSIFFLHTSTFQLLDRPWSQVSSLFPPGYCLNFYRAEGSAAPLLVDVPSSVANSRTRAFRESICAQEKAPTKLYEYALGGTQTHETDLYQARG